MPALEEPAEEPRLAPRPQRGRPDRDEDPRIDPGVFLLRGVEQVIIRPVLFEPLAASVHEIERALDAALFGREPGADRGLANLVDRVRDDHDRRYPRHSD